MKEEHFVQRFPLRRFHPRRRGCSPRLPPKVQAQVNRCGAGNDMGGGKLEPCKEAGGGYPDPGYMIPRKGPGGAVFNITRQGPPTPRPPHFTSMPHGRHTPAVYDDFHFCQLDEFCPCLSAVCCWGVIFYSGFFERRGTPSRPDEAKHQTTAPPKKEKENRYRQITSPARSTPPHSCKHTGPPPVDKGGGGTAVRSHRWTAESWR